MATLTQQVPYVMLGTCCNTSECEVGNMLHVGQVQHADKLPSPARNSLCTISYKLLITYLRYTVHALYIDLTIAPFNLTSNCGLKS